MAEIRICRTQRLRHGATSRSHRGARAVPDPPAQLRAVENNPTRTVLITDEYKKSPRPGPLPVWRGKGESCSVRPVAELNRATGSTLQSLAPPKRGEGGAERWVKMCIRDSAMPADAELFNHGIRFFQTEPDHGGIHGLLDELFERKVQTADGGLRFGGCLLYTSRCV